MIEPTDFTETTTPNVLAAQSEPAQNGIMRAAVILSVGNVAQRILGMAREIVKAYLFGASGLLSAYEIAVYVPLNLYELIIGGMVNSALVPVFSEYAFPERRKELWGVVSAFLSAATVVLLLVVLLVEVFAPQIAIILGARNFEDPALLELSISLMRMAAPAIFFLSISSILTGVLYALKRFALPAMTAAVFNACIVIVALARPEDIDSLVWGLLLGSVMQIVIQIPGLRDARIRWRLHWNNPVIRRILRLYAPIVVGLIITQIGLAISINLATRTGDASLTYMRYATTLYQFPLGLVVTALSIATLPTLSQQAASRLADFKQTLAEGIRLVIVFILPATAGLFVMALPIVALLFEYGEFTTSDTVITATVLRYYLFGLPFAAVDQMLVFASYARKDTLRPALVGVFSILIYVGVAAMLLDQYGILSLMIADAVKHAIHMALMILVLARQGVWLGGYGIIGTIVRSGIAAIFSGGAAYVVFIILKELFSLDTLPGRLLTVIAAGTAGLIVFAGMVYLLNIQEAKSFRSIISRRKTK